MWSEGTIGNLKGGNKEGICHYWVKHFDEPSRFGINGGKISKLMIKKDGVITCNYDRGWDVEPQDDDEMTKLALCILLNNYN